MRIAKSTFWCKEESIIALISQLMVYEDKPTIQQARP
jgi:hypothetical protein